MSFADPSAGKAGDIRESSEEMYVHVYGFVPLYVLGWIHVLSYVLT